MDDLISRAEAINAVKKNTFRLTFAEEQNCEGHVAWSANAVYSDVMEGALLELPSAQPEPKTGRWISEQDMTDKLTRLINEFEMILSDIREKEVDDSVCGLCEYDTDHGMDGYANECPGFERDDCFRLKDEYRKEWMSMKC